MIMHDYKLHMEAVSLYNKLKITVNRIASKGFWNSPTLIEDELEEHIFKYVVSVYFKGIPKKPRVNSKIFNFIYSLITQKTQFDVNYNAYDRLTEKKCVITEEESFYLSTLMDEKIGRQVIWKYISKHQGKMIVGVPDYLIACIEKDIEENTNNSREVIKILRDLGIFAASFNDNLYEEKMNYINSYMTYLKSIVDLNDVKPDESAKPEVENEENYKEWDGVSIESFDTNPYMDLMKKKEQKMERQKVLNEWLKEGEIKKSGVSKEFIQNEILPLAVKDSEEERAKELERSFADSAYREYINQIESFVGISGVKEEIYFLIDLIKVNNWRKKNNLPLKPVPNKFLFSGSKGIGKSKIAEIIAMIYAKAGIIEKWDLSTVNLEEIINEGESCEGQSHGITVEKILSIANGGVLYINAVKSFDKPELRKKLLDLMAELNRKFMQDNEKLVLIIGVELDKGEAVIAKTNEAGVEFDRHFRFENYNYDEMIETIEIMAYESGYKLNSESKIHIINYLKENKVEQLKSIHEVKVLLKSILDRAVLKQISRLAKEAALDKETLMMLTKNDFEF